MESDLLENYKYKDALDSASSFNTKLLVERQSRLPFLDTQTNIAQVRSCNLVDYQTMNFIITPGVNVLSKRGSYISHYIHHVFCLPVRWVIED